MRSLTSCYKDFELYPTHIRTAWTECDEGRKRVAMTFWKNEFDDVDVSDYDTMRVYCNVRRHLRNGEEWPHGRGYRRRLEHLEFAHKHNLPIDVILLTPTPRQQTKERETVDWKMRVDFVRPDGDFRLIRV
jgi:hypothetical protein